MGSAIAGVSIRAQLEIVIQGGQFDERSLRPHFRADACPCCLHISLCIEHASTLCPGTLHSVVWQSDPFPPPPHPTTHSPTHPQFKGLPVSNDWINMPFTFFLIIAFRASCCFARCVQQRVLPSMGFTASSAVFHFKITKKIPCVAPCTRNTRLT